MTKARWVALLKRVGPVIIAALVPGLPAALVPLVIGGIETAEGLKGLSGPAKKAAALQLVRVVTATANEAQPGLFPQAATTLASDAIDATVAAVNALHRRQAA